MDPNLNWKEMSPTERVASVLLVAETANGDAAIIKHGWSYVEGNLGGAPLLNSDAFGELTGSRGSGLALALMDAIDDQGAQTALGWMNANSPIGEAQAAIAVVCSARELGTDLIESALTHEFNRSRTQLS